ncbi:CHAT domain-containing protein [Mycena pura]|uniref:CHAT domain-containing protein n=1 Tax=Mycena pura TaxID=153505 RepID=A0AAD7E5E1_9AGAR|nr:CHAT domain-containing protein [Mycena pura]
MEQLDTKWNSRRDSDPAAVELQLQDLLQSIISNDHPERAQDLYGFAEILRNQYSKRGDLNALEAAFQCNEVAVNITPENHPNLPHYLMSLVHTQRAKYRRLGNVEDLEDALKNCRRALALMPVHQDLHESLAVISALYNDRFHRLGDIKDLNTALDTQEIAIKLAAEGHPALPRYLGNLAAFFGARYQRLGLLEDVEESIRKHKIAVNLTPHDDPQLPQRYHNLAIAYGDRYERTARLQDLEDALENFRTASNLRPSGHRENAKHLHGLSVSLRDRYQRLEDLQDLENALEKEHLAIKLTPEDHAGLPEFLENLTACLQDRYQRLGDLRDLDVSITTDQEILQLTPEGHPKLAGRLHSLAVALSYRYSRLERLDDLESALEKIKHAVDLAFEDQALLPRRLHLLANILDLRCKRLGNTEDLDSVIAIYQRAVNITPQNHPDLPEYLQALALAQSEKWEQTKHSGDLQAALSNYSRSLEIPAIKPILSWNSAIEWASLARENQSPQCLTAYKHAFALLPEIVWVGSNLSVYQHTMKGVDISVATSDAISACIDYSNLKLAVEILEQGLATRFQHMLQLKTKADNIPEPYKERFQELSSELYTGLAADPAKVASERNTLLEKIRVCSGFENFLRPMSYDDISRACRNGPVIVLNAGSRRCDALILRRPRAEPIHIPLPEVSSENLEQQRSTLLKVLRHCNARTREVQSSRLFGRREGLSSKSTAEYFEDILNWLWKSVISPLLQVLESDEYAEGRIWWCLTGAFVGLPVHAASKSDKFIHSYTSTLGALNDGYLRNSSAIPTVGVVGVTHSRKASEGILPGVEQEVKVIKSIVGQSKIHSLVGSQATMVAVKIALQQCSWIHLACHGKQDLVDPPKSRLQLYEGNLELEAILQMQLSHAEFVYLAACETAMGGTHSEMVNESFHLGGGFIAAGFKGAIGTLWSMRDLDGPVVANAVYMHLFRNGQPKASEAARALQIAVRKLRNEGVPHERWVPFIHMGI